jgi:hypothetical protein
LDGRSQSTRYVMAEEAPLPPAVYKKSRDGGYQQPSDYGDPGTQASRGHPDFLSRGAG